jgi:glucose-1-phosphate thymidylyltransferase
MVEHILDRVNSIDAVIDGVYIVTNDKFYGHFTEWAEKTPFDVTIINDGTKTNEDRLGAIGDIDYVIKDQKIDDELMVIAGDNLFEFDMKTFYDYYWEKNKSVMAIYDLKDKELLANKFGVVELNEEKRIIGFEEKPAEPKTTLTATACYIFSKEDVMKLEKCIDENESPDNLGDFIRWLAEREEVYGFVFEEGWYDIGSKEDLTKVRELMG